MRRTALTVCVALLCVIASWGYAFGLPPVQRTVLDNGLVLLVSEEHSLPFVTINLMIKTGSKDDPPGEEGLADLTASGLLLGAAGRTLKQINEELDFMGADMRRGRQQGLHHCHPAGLEEGPRTRLSYLHGCGDETHLSCRRGQEGALPHPGRHPVVGGPAGHSRGPGIREGALPGRSLRSPHRRHARHPCRN